MFFEKGGFKVSFLSRLNRKSRRQFDNLSKEEKKDIISKEINEKIKETINKEVAMAFADGFLFASKMLYDKYFQNWSSAKYNDKHKIAKELMKEIEENTEKYNNRRGLNKTKENSENKKEDDK